MNLSQFKISLILLLKFIISIKSTFIYDQDIPIDYLKLPNITTKYNCNTFLNKSIDYSIKENIVYSQVYDLYYYNDDNFIWSLIDTLIINPNNPNIKDIICTSHNNNVRSILMINQNEFNQYSITNFTKLIQLIQLNGGDGILLNLNLNLNLKYLNDIKSFYNIIKQININYYLSISIPLSWNDIYTNQIILNCDYLILQSFNNLNYTGVIEYQYGNPISGDHIRQTFNKYWYEPYINLKFKLLIGLSLIGNQKSCTTNNNRLNIFNLNNCERLIIINDNDHQQELNNNIINLSYNDIYNYIIGNGNGYIGSGELWNFKTHTPYLNFINLNNSNVIYQIQYENTKSLYYKIVNTGAGGISLMNIDESITQYDYYLNNLLTILNKNITNSNYNNNIYLY